MTHVIGRAAEQPNYDTDDSGVDLLGALQEYVQEKQEEQGEKILRLPIPGRERIIMHYKPHKLDYDTFNLFTKKATEGKGNNKTVNYKKLATSVLTNTNVGIVYNGKPMEEEGEELTIVHHQVHRAVGVHPGSTNLALWKLYGNDGSMLQHMRKVLDEAGYDSDEEVQEADDTGPLSD